MRADISMSITDIKVYIRAFNLDSIKQSFNLRHLTERYIDFLYSFKIKINIQTSFLLR